MGAGAVAVKPQEPLIGWGIPLARVKTPLEELGDLNRKLDESKNFPRSLEMRFSDVFSHIQTFSEISDLMKADFYHPVVTEQSTAIKQTWLRIMTEEVDPLLDKLNKSPEQESERSRYLLEREQLSFLLQANLSRLTGINDGIKSALGYHISEKCTKDYEEAITDKVAHNDLRRDYFNWASSYMEGNTVVPSERVETAIAAGVSKNKDWSGLEEMAKQPSFVFDSLAAAWAIKTNLSEIYEAAAKEANRADGRGVFHDVLDDLLFHSQNPAVTGLAWGMLTELRGAKKEEGEIPERDWVG